MPIYEYRCTQCKNVFEEWSKSVGDHGDAICPKCRGNAVQIISDTSFILKGGGWYVTEYGNQKNKNQDTDDTSTTKTDSSTEQTAKTDTITEQSSNVTENKKNKTIDNAQSSSPTKESNPTSKPVVGESSKIVKKKNSE